MGHVLFPRKADPVLIVDAQAVLSPAVSLKGFEPVAGGNQEIGERICAVKRGQPPQCDRFNALEFLNPVTIP
jgi:hypothetical protein